MRQASRQDIIQPGAYLFVFLKTHHPKKRTLEFKACCGFLVLYKYILLVQFKLLKLACPKGTQENVLSVSSH